MGIYAEMDKNIAFLMELNTTCNKTFNEVIVFYLFYPQGKKYNKYKYIAILKKQLKKIKVKLSIIYIDNSANEHFVKKISDNEYEISGDNKYNEFSGWQRGIDFVGEIGLKANVFIFVNDTFHRDPITYRKILAQQVVQCSAQYNAAIGKRKLIEAEGYIMGEWLKAYMQTHIFVLSKKIVKEIGSFVSLTEEQIDSIFIKKYNYKLKLFQDDALVSVVIRDFIFKHLTKKWYRRRKYNEETFWALRKKAISIFNSIALSIRIRNIRAPLIEYNKSVYILRNNIDFNNIFVAWDNPKRSFLSVVCSKLGIDERHL